MMIADSKTIKALDEEAIRSGIPSYTLMERAASGLISCAEAMLGNLNGRTIAVFCGSGNNGGDGVAFCRIAIQRGAHLRCILTGDPDRLSGDMYAMLKLWLAEGGTVEVFAPQEEEQVHFVLHCDLIIDAIFGIGFHGALRGSVKDAAQLINRSAASVLSADLPSGAESDSALVAEDCIRADYTVTFTCQKPAHCIQPAKSYCGKILISDIGIPKSIIESAEAANRVDAIQLVDETYLDKVIHKRNPNTHKGDYGKVLIIGGSVGYTGAPYLTATGAFKTGSGLVYLAVPDSIYAIEAVKCNETICLPFAGCDGHFSIEALPSLLSLAEKCDVCVLGMGLGRSEDTDRLTEELLQKLTIPVVLDADGINAVSQNIMILFDRASKGRTTVITPHDVEFQRLGGDLSEGRIHGAVALAQRTGAVVVLKGNTTITASPDGIARVNTSGNPGMAKGGSGDVLAGVIASLIGQGIQAEVAAAAGAFLHGTAGDIAARRIGEYGMLPTDLCEEIPAVLKRFDAKPDNLKILGRQS